MLKLTALTAILRALTAIICACCTSGMSNAPVQGSGDLTRQIYRPAPEGVPAGCRPEERIGQAFLLQQLQPLLYACRTHATCHPGHTTCDNTLHEQQLTDCVQRQAPLWPCCCIRMRLMRSCKMCHPSITLVNSKKSTQYLLLLHWCSGVLNLPQALCCERVTA